jgi:hypothetical protein
VANQALEDSCAADPFQKEAAEEAQINWVFSREELRNFKDRDWSAV